LYNVFFGVFELPSQKNTRNSDKTKKVDENLTSKFLSKFWKKGFDTDFLPKYFNGVFELPLPRNAHQKRTKKKVKKKKVGWWVGGSEIYRCTGGSVDFFWRPLGAGPLLGAGGWGLGGARSRCRPSASSEQAVEVEGRRGVGDLSVIENRAPGGRWRGCG
jgi:hypothetical protein